MMSEDNDNESRVLLLDSRSSSADSLQSDDLRALQSTHGLREDVHDDDDNNDDDDPRTNGTFLVRTCFFSRRLEMVFDYALMLVGIWALAQTDAACRSFRPPLFPWMVAATALRAVDALNYSWVMWLKPRMDPRRRRPLRYVAVVVRALTLMGSLALVVMVNVWGRTPQKTGGNEVSVPCTPLFAVTMSINYWMSFLQTSALLLFTLMVTCYGGFYCRQQCGCTDVERNAYAASAHARNGARAGNGNDNFYAGAGNVNSRPLASRDALRSLTEVITFDALVDARDEVECCICCEEFKSDDELRSLPCHHFFHRRCVDPWLNERTGTCPVCRTMIE